MRLAHVGLVVAARRFMMRGCDLLAGENDYGLF